MKWYGLIRKNNIILKSKNSINIKKKNYKFYFKPRFNLNYFKLNFFFPNQWDITLLNLNQKPTITACKIYSLTYYFYLFFTNKFLFLNYD